MMKFHPPTETVPPTLMLPRLGCTHYDGTPAGTSPWQFPIIAF